MRVICIINSWGYASYFMHFIRAYIASIIILASRCKHCIMVIALCHMHHLSRAWDPSSSCCTIIAIIHLKQCITFMDRAFCHYSLIASIGMFCNQHYQSHSDNELWAGMFRTSFINLLCYFNLLSISFVMNVADIYHPHVVILILWELDHLSFFLSRHASTTFIVNINLPWCDCFLILLMGDLLLFP
jgi:hypothetical protein